MRNLKKHLSVLLVLMMVFTMLAPVFATTSYNYEEAAQALYGLGLYKGVSDKNFVPDLGSQLNRQQAAIILLRLFGQEQDAQALTDAQVNQALAKFADADSIASWARKQVAYAAMTGVVKGIQSANGLVFNPVGALKGIDYASLILQQLGVKDFDYFGALEKLASLNVISVAQMIAFDKDQLTRDDAVGMSYGVLTAQADNGSTVIENLIEKGLVERAYAEELGLVEKTNTPAVNPSTEPSQNPNGGTVVGTAKVEFEPAESRVLSRSQSLFEIGQVKITAGSEPVVVTGLKLQRTGISADTVVKSITVWNGNEKVNSIGRFSTGIANIAFTKIVTVPAGQTVKLPIKINVNNTAGIASELKISLLEVKSDTALAGTFPMVGNAFTISEVDLGEIEAKISGDAPVASLNAGDKDVRLAKFDFEVRSEAQTIKRIVFSQDGTAADTDLANLRLVDEDGTVLAKGEMNRGELVFDLNRECASGTTARLTIRGDVVGGAGRTIQFSIDNVNDIQSVGKVYGTTIIANGTIDGSKLTVEKGAFILTKSASSPAAATVATTVDDQKFAAIKVEAIGEPIQLETVSVSIKSSDTETSDKKVREIKLVSNGVIIASQEIKKNDDVSNVELPLSEVVTVEPNSPITIDVLIDLKDAVKDKTYEVGIFKIDGSGLVSEKDISFNKDEIEDEVIYGSLMTVGDIKVTLEQKAQVNGYVFPNQSEEILAEFNIKHNLGETVRLSALKVKIAKGDNADAGNDLVAKTFKNVKLVSASGSVVSETVINPTTSELNIALKEGVTVEAGKTIRLGLMADIRAGANPGDVFKFAAIDASAVTIATGTTVSASKTSEEIESAIADSRSVEISSGATEEDVKANKSDEVLKDKNVVANTSNVEIARWKLTNESNEDVGVNKVYLTAKYNGQTPKDGQKRDLQRAYVQCVLKDDKGTVLTDTSEPFTLNKNVVTEIDILKDSNRSKLLIDAANNSGDGERELILYANIADGAQVGGSISVQLGSDVDNGNLFEITGRISGLTTTVKGNPIESDNKTTVSVSVVNANALSGNKNVTENEYSSEKGVKGETLGKFSIKNTGKTAVGVRQIVLRLDDQSTYGDEIKKLELYDSDGNKVALDPVSDWVEIKKANEVVVANPNYGTISKWLEIYENHEDENIKNIYDNDTPDDDNSADAIIEKAHKYVIFNIASSKIKISAGKDEVFEVRTESDKLLPTGSKITLFVDKAHTYTDKASFDGYEICLDNEKDVNLGTVEVKAKN